MDRTIVIVNYVFVHYVGGDELNIARIANAVQVAICLSTANPQCPDLSFAICQ